MGNQRAPANAVRTTPHPPECWLVAFTDHRPGAGAPSWRNRLLEVLLSCLRPGFRHCLALRRVPTGWLVVDPLSDGLRCDLSPEGSALGLIAAGATVVEVTSAHLPPDRAQWRPAGLLTCVTVVKSLLGLTCRAVTPYQLYRHLTGRP